MGTPLTWTVRGEECKSFDIWGIRYVVRDLRICPEYFKSMLGEDFAVVTNAIPLEILGDCSVRLKIYMGFHATFMKLRQKRTGFRLRHVLRFDLGGGTV